MKDIDVIASETGLTVKDVRLIHCVVSCCGSVDEMYNQLKKIIKDITVSHYFVMGAMIGYHCATGQERNNYNKSISLCQRLN